METRAVQGVTGEIEVPVGLRHGTRYAYNTYGCRCRACVAVANVRAGMAHRKRRSGGWWVKHERVEVVAGVEVKLGGGELESKYPEVLENWILTRGTA